MRVLSALVSILSVVAAGDIRNTGSLVSTGGSSGTYSSNEGTGVASFSSPVGSGSNYGSGSLPLNSGSSLGSSSLPGSSNADYSSSSLPLSSSSSFGSSSLPASSSAGYGSRSGFNSGPSFVSNVLPVNSGSGYSSGPGLVSSALPSSSGAGYGSESISSGSGYGSSSGPINSGSSYGFINDAFGGNQGYSSSVNNDLFGGNQGFKTGSLGLGGSNVNYGGGAAANLGGDIFGGQSLGNADAAATININSNDFSAAGGLQRGVAQVSTLDQVADRKDRRDDKFVRDYARQEQGAGRSDNQERSGDFREAEQDQNRDNDANRRSTDRRKYQQQAGRWNQDSRRQQDQETRKGAAIKSDGEYAKYDANSNDGQKALSSRKAVFANGDIGFKHIDYNFDKDFDQLANEKGGYREETGRDDTNSRVYREKQRDHRFGKSDNDAFRKAADRSRTASSAEWLQNALQKQGQNNQYGSADKLKDAAAKQAADFKTFFDKQDDRVWNADSASDAAYRGAQDLARKDGLFNKDSIANAHGKKGVADNRYYGGKETGNGRRSLPYGYGTQGVNEYEPRSAGGNAGYGRGNTGAVGDINQYNNNNIGLQGGAVGNVVGTSGPNSPTKRRLEESGGNIANIYRENAVQGDLATQRSNNEAGSSAKANNQYLRDKGLQDSIEQDRKNEGRWANQREGYRDSTQQGYNGDNAQAARAGEAVDNSYSDSSSASELEAANNNLDIARLDRINQKSNKVDSNQNIISNKQFYHDKNQKGYNNEDLSYNQNRGNNDYGGQEAAQQEARTRFSNLHQNNKNSRGRRRYEDFDARRISNGDAVNRKHRANGGNAEAFARARDDARRRSEGFNKNKERKEYDIFSQLNKQQNQKLWDRANRDLFSRNSGNNHNRRVDGIFQYQNDGISGGPLRFGGSRSNTAGLGSRKFGLTPLQRQGDNYSINVPSNQNTNTFGTGYGSAGRGGGQAVIGQYW